MKKIQIITLLVLGLGIFCLIAEALSESFESTQSYIKPDGILIEPFFGLLPIGAILIVIGIILVSVQAIFYFIFRSKRSLQKKQ
ncbi:DUF3955 domain-containing protein [Chryseobacterium sp.]|uniref:DUF3955 domain-containing protein n=1 Tax=Chryseobacterium sp. TaxID=1871047 RepID=UPI0031E37E60